MNKPPKVLQQQTLRLQLTSMTYDLEIQTRGHAVIHQLNQLMPYRNYAMAAGTCSWVYRSIDILYIDLYCLIKLLIVNIQY